MRYILNDSGFIETISFTHEVECNNKTCTEYTGTVPTGYETLAIWSETANINAYKIVNGNLTYDSEEDARLQSLWASQQTSNMNDAEVLNTKNNSTTDTYSCNYINGTFANGRTEEIGTFDDVGVEGQLQRSGLYTVVENGTWYNLLNIRHRNGENDGIFYGLQMRKEMVYGNEKLQFRQQHTHWENWKTVQEEGITLYDNSSGGDGTITLNESVANFRSIKILYFLLSSVTPFYSSTEVDSPNGKIASLSSIYVGNGRSIMGFANVTLSGTNIVMGSNVTYTSDNMVSPAATNEIHIYKVVGYR